MAKAKTKGTKIHVSRAARHQAGKRASAKARKRRNSLPITSKIPGLYYPAGVTPEDFFEALGKLRKEAEIEIDRLLDFLNHSDGYSVTELEPDGDEADDLLDLGEGNEDGKDPDLEPLLAPSDSMDQVGAWALCNNNCDDREDENEHGESDNGGCVDDEPSLGSLNDRISQLRWGQPDRYVGWGWGCVDLEYDEAENEDDDDDEREAAIDDQPHDEQICWHGIVDEVGLTWPLPSNANEAFGSV
jgi:hypothetical protein